MQTLIDWSNYHAELFHFVADADLQMLVAWRELFAAQGFTAAELAEASRWLALHHATNYRVEHPTLLAGRIRARREEAARLDSQERQQRQLAAERGPEYRPLHLARRLRRGQD